MIVIRRIEEEDEPRWRELWDGYTRFYEREPEEEITRHTWARIMDPSYPIYSVVAETHHKRVVGMANYVLHESTSTLTQICCMQDLFVDPAERCHGVGKQLIEWLVCEAKSQGWSRLYWHTRENNYRARALYDQFTPHSGFLRYVISPDI